MSQQQREAIATILRAQASQALWAKLPSTLEILNPAAPQDKDPVTLTRVTAARYHLTSMQGETT